MADKTREEKDTVDRKQGIHKLRQEFWAALLEQYAGVSSSFQNVSPTKDSWIPRGSGISGIVFSFVFTTKHANIEVFIGRKDKDENKRIFDFLFQNKADIEAQFGGALDWQRLDDKKGCRIAYFLNDVSINNDENREAAAKFFITYMPKLEKAMEKPLIKSRSVIV